MADDLTSATLPSDFADRIRQYRDRLGLTQGELAARLGVSFATVNRWENGQTKPSPLAWQRLIRLDEGESEVTEAKAAPVEPPVLDFTGSPRSSGRWLRASG